MSRVACAQFAPRLGDKAANLEAVCRLIGEADADLVVFPECALTGYGFESREEALAAAEPAEGPSIRRVGEALKQASAKRAAWAVVGMLELAAGKVYNSALLVGPYGMAGLYRKMHLPHLGVDRFADAGDLGFPVYSTGFCKVGMLICYDASFPEAARVLKLGGAQLIALPTNWPREAEVSTRVGPVARAHENHVFVAAANRVGEEAGFAFRGESSLTDFEGRVLARAGGGEAVISAELDFKAADDNRLVYRPGRYELDRIAHRRPDWYGPLVEPVRAGRPAAGPPRR